MPPQIDSAKRIEAILYFRVNIYCMRMQANTLVLTGVIAEPAGRKGIGAKGICGGGRGGGGHGIVGGG